MKKKNRQFRMQGIFCGELCSRSARAGRWCFRRVISQFRKGIKKANLLAGNEVNQGGWAASIGPGGLDSCPGGGDRRTGKLSSVQGIGGLDSCPVSRR
jgi:hypothetical protein